MPASHWAAAWIERLAATGITIGCGGGNYCPNTPLTRDQMAIFLLRAKHGSGYKPPPATGARFGDVPASHWAAAWIEQLAQEGITGGCGGGNYCPNASVNRDQMAAFLVRTFSLGEKFRLAIRPFGSGDVRATIQSSALPGGGMIEWCGTLPAQSDCHYDLPEGASVRLLPEAAPGWMFSHWLGCDRIENTECVLVMRDDHRTVAPTFDSPREVTLQPDVVMLSAETVALLEGETETTLTFAARATQIQGLQPGAVIVSVHGEGFARRVAGVRTVNGSLVVETFPATLEDVIQEGVIVYSQTLRRADLLQAMPAPGVRVLEPLSVKDWGTKLKLEIDTKSSADWPENRPQLTGFIEVTLTPDFALDMRLFGTNELRTAMVVKVETQLDVDLSQTEKFELKPIPLGKYRHSAPPNGEKWNSVRIMINMNIIKEKAMAVHVATGTMRGPITYQSYNLDHLGLVDELDIVNLIDMVIVQDHEQRI